MNIKSLQKTRAQLLTIFSIALDAVNGAKCVSHYLAQNPLPTDRIWVAAVGKAASSMMEGVISHLKATGSESRLAAGLVIYKRGYAAANSALGANSNVTLFESDHPVPSLRSLEAGRRLVEFVKKIPSTDTFLFLVSGGTSSLVEVLPDTEMDPEKQVGDNQVQELVALNNFLLSNPWPIDVINKVRQSVSCIKNGQLLDVVPTPYCIQLTISDVANNDLSIIGSGLLEKGTEPLAEINIDLPDWVKQMQQRCIDNHKKPISGQQHVKHRIIADNAKARQAIVDYAASVNLPVVVNATIEGEVATASERITTSLVNGEAGLYVWGGETVVQLPEKPGKGGRCQSLALMIAEKIQHQENTVVLAIGTDGSDGPGDAAGALVDATTIQRGLQLSLDSKQALLDANAGYYLAETGDLIDTGATGSNVMDLVIAVKLDPR